MDGCSLTDAFPGDPSVGCTDTKSTENQRKQERKKAKKCRGPQSWYVSSDFPLGSYGSDPDRPAVKRMAEVPSLNSQTGLNEHSPVDEEYTYEPFVSDSGCLPDLRKSVKSSSALQSGSSPSFFGVNPSDDSMLSNLKEGFANANPSPYVNIIGNDKSYKLEPDFTDIGKAKGYSVAAGKASLVGIESVNDQTAYLTPTSMSPSTALPTPNIDMFWRKNTGVTGGSSSYFAKLDGTSADVQQQLQPQADTHNISQKLDKIFARLDDMDTASAESAQTEVLLFIMTGLGIIFLMDLACRTAAKVV